MMSWNDQRSKIAREIQKTYFLPWKQDTWHWEQLQRKKVRLTLGWQHDQFWLQMLHVVSLEFCDRSERKKKKHLSAVYFTCLSTDYKQNSDKRCKLNMKKSRNDAFVVLMDVNSQQKKFGVKYKNFVGPLAGIQHWELHKPWLRESKVPCSNLRKRYPFLVLNECVFMIKKETYSS